ncbi:hypothetical protein HZH68_006819 [Vespula germanica]|uniref:Uncharacterized protein n=1 Tax=Vespula germanica TaxID=30212 RepID=A0A834NBL6_VESGE|nr:hypothetical protein HZH68_006819 [Vespula germanica]
MKLDESRNRMRYSIDLIPYMSVNLRQIFISKYRLYSLDEMLKIKNIPESRIEGHFRTVEISHGLVCQQQPVGSQAVLGASNTSSSSSNSNSNSSQPVRQSAGQLTGQPEPTGQNQPTNQPASQPASQPTNQPNQQTRQPVSSSKASQK